MKNTVEDEDGELIGARGSSVIEASEA